MDLSFLEEKLKLRKQENAYRSLKVNPGYIDFCSNDYLGISHDNLLSGFTDSNDHTGSTGSRLLSGNYILIEEAENLIAAFHNASSGLIFNSGYDANLALMSCIAKKTDTIIYDELSHASIRDGLRLSTAKSFSFRHNDLDDLEKKLKQSTGIRFVVTESVFSMDGHLAPLQDIAALCYKYSAYLIVDEAHATGIIGIRGEGLVQHLELENKCFARVHTFGKALGTHGAIILGEKPLKEYLINYARPLIYSTSLPETAIRTIAGSYNTFPSMLESRQKLIQLVVRFQSADIPFNKLQSETPIQGVIAGGNDKAKKLAQQISRQRIDVRPILYPTVPKGTERLRIVLHSFNSFNELDTLVNILKMAN